MKFQTQSKFLPILIVSAIILVILFLLIESSQEKIFKLILGLIMILVTGNIGVQFVNNQKKPNYSLIWMSFFLLSPLLLAEMELILEPFDLSKITKTLVKLGCFVIIGVLGYFRINTVKIQH